MSERIERHAERREASLPQPLALTVGLLATVKMLRSALHDVLCSSTVSRMPKAQQRQILLPMNDRAYGSFT
jgi:hypothetical protein